MDEGGRGHPCLVGRPPKTKASSGERDDGPDRFYGSEEPGASQEPIRARGGSLARLVRSKKLRPLALDTGFYTQDSPPTRAREKSSLAWCQPFGCAGTRRCHLHRSRRTAGRPPWFCLRRRQSCPTILHATTAGRWGRTIANQEAGTVVVTGKGGATVIENPLIAVRFWASMASALNRDVPGVLGVPEICPVDGSSASPFGNVP